MRLPIEFVVPPLVEGPGVVFHIPLPQFAHDFPFAQQMANGSYGLPVTNTVTTTWIIMLLLLAFFKFGTRKLNTKPSKFQAFLETLYTMYDALVNQSLGSWKKKYFSYISTLITFILVANIITFFPVPKFSIVDGVFTISPLFRAPTADINTTLGLALIMAYMFLAASFKTSGPIGYIKGLCEPTPVMLPMNIIGEFAKIINVSMRLFGNMFAGMVIMGLIYKAAPWFVPAPLHLYFDLFSGLVQAFVFTMLTMVYISGALGDAKPDFE